MKAWGAGRRRRGPNIKTTPKPEPMPGQTWVRPSRPDKGSAECWTGETRHVVDRTLGGGVVYRLGRGRSEHTASFAEWQEFAKLSRCVKPAKETP